MMIEIKLDKHHNAYDIVGEYVERYWQEHYYTDVIVRMATSYNGKIFAPFNEIVLFNGDTIEYINDWWEGEEYLQIYGIIDIHKVTVPDNL